MKDDAMPLSWVYIANSASNFISRLALEKDGKLRDAGHIAVGAPVSPLALSPDRRFLYAALRGDRPAVAAYAVHSADGELSPLAVTPVPSIFSYMSVADGGKCLLAASYSDGVVCSLPLENDGSVGGEPLSLLRPGRNPHCILPDANSRFAFAPILGDDKIEQYRLDDGRLAPQPFGPVRTPPLSGPRHLTLDPGNRHAYLLAELSGEVFVYRVDAGNGVLNELQSVSIMPPGSALPPGTYTPPLNREGGGNSPHPVIWAADIHLAPDGKHLYASERTTSIVTCFNVDGPSGRLTYAFSVEAEAQPRGFAIDPSGEFLLVAGEKSGAAASYAIDRESGALAAVGRAAVGDKPNWVEIAPCG